MKKYNHTHKYIKTHIPALTSVNCEQWKCSISGCVHFLPTNCTVVGRLSICHQCDDKFVMTNNQLEMNEPICNDCKFKFIWRP